MKFLHPGVGDSGIAEPQGAEVRQAVEVPQAGVRDFRRGKIEVNGRRVGRVPGRGGCGVGAWCGSMERSPTRMVEERGPLVARLLRRSPAARKLVMRGQCLKM